MRRWCIGRTLDTRKALIVTHVRGLAILTALIGTLAVYLQYLLG